MATSCVAASRTPSWRATYDDQAEGPPVTSTRALEGLGLRDYEVSCFPISQSWPNGSETRAERGPVVVDRLLGIAHGQPWGDVGLERPCTAWRRSSSSPLVDRRPRDGLGRRSSPQPQRGGSRRHHLCRHLDTIGVGEPTHVARRAEPAHGTFDLAAGGTLGTDFIAARPAQGETPPGPHGRVRNACLHHALPSTPQPWAHRRTFCRPALLPGSAAA